MQIYATAGGIVFYSTSLDYVATFPFPSEPAYTGSRGQDERCVGFDLDRNGDVSSSVEYGWSTNDI